MQAAAREARYALLADAAVAAGADALFVAHTADDMAETLLARLGRGSGPDGLAAMRAIGRIAAGPGEPVLLARPLLDVRRAGVLATLQRFRQKHLDDPSNEDSRFERVRARATLAQLEAANLVSIDALARSAERLRAAADGETARARRTLAACAFMRWGGVRVPHALWARLPRADAEALARRLVFAVSGARSPVNREDAAAAVERAIAGTRATFAGALIIATGEDVTFEREPAGLLGRAGEAAAPPLTLGVSKKALWDQRFIVSADAEVTIRASGRTGDLGGAPSLFTGERFIGGLHLETGEWRAPPTGVRLHSLIRERALGDVVRFQGAGPVAGP